METQTHAAPAVRDQIVELAKKHRITEIVKTTGLSRQWISKILKREGVTAVGQHDSRDVQAQRNAKIIRDFDRGVEVPDIATEVNLSPDHVRRILRDHKKPARSRSEQRQQEIVDMYRDDVPVLDIVEALGVSRRWVHKVVRKHNVPLRTASA